MRLSKDGWATQKAPKRELILSQRQLEGCLFGKAHALSFNRPCQVMQESNIEAGHIYSGVLVRFSK